MAQLALIVIAAWSLLALMALPVAVRLGRAAYAADLAAEHQHQALQAPAAAAV